MLSRLNKTLLFELYEYLHPPEYKVLDWIYIGYDNIFELMYNANPISNTILLKNLDMISERDRSLVLCKSRDINLFIKNIYTLDSRCWEELCKNPCKNVIKIIKKNVDKLNTWCWFNLSKSKDPDVIQFIEKNISKLSLVSLGKLYSNPIFFPKIQNIEQFPSNCWYWICTNPNPGVFDLVRKNINKINRECWDCLLYHSHPKLVDLLEENLDKINWGSLTQNYTNPKIYLFLKKHVDKLDHLSWKNICYNTNSDILYLLAENISKVCWVTLCLNTNTDILNFVIQNSARLNYSCFLNLCSNSNTVAISFVKKNLNNFRQTMVRKVLVRLCQNPNPCVLDIINPYLHLFDFDCWSKLCLNPSGWIIPILEKNIDKLNWGNIYKNYDNKDMLTFLSKYNHQFIHIDWNCKYLLSNPNIFQIDHHTTLLQKKKWITTLPL